jgi:hypothetical protein
MVDCAIDLPGSPVAYTTVCASPALTGLASYMQEAERKVAVPTSQDIQPGLPETVSLLDKLRMAIYQGEFMPGLPLVESELAARYDTTRGAIREALVRLENEG